LREELLSRYSDVRFNDEGRSLAGPDLISFLAGRRGAITGLERIDDDVLQAVPSLSVVAKIGVGVDMLDLEAFERRGVRLARAEGTNSRSVAELVILLTLGVLRRVPEVGAGVRSGRWEQPRGRELTGKTVGIVGLGHVGREVARLVAAFDCSVLAVDPYPGELPRGVRLADLDEILRECDVVSLHVPLAPDTTALIGRRELALMKSDAVIINTARGRLIEEAALVEALEAEQLAGVGLDVLADEPPIDTVLLAHPKVFLTSHIGGSTDEAVYAMGRAAIDGLHRALSELRADQVDA
jgi:D-3-phosphoglycerate dehydrogenase